MKYRLSYDGDLQYQPKLDIWRGKECWRAKIAGVVLMCGVNCTAFSAWNNSVFGKGCALNCLSVDEGGTAIKCPEFILEEVPDWMEEVQEI